MRDAIILSLVLLGGLQALRHPWVGVMLWTWISMMNPHRYSYGFAYEAPVAAFAAGCTVIGLLATRDARRSPFLGPVVGVFAAFLVWITLSWLNGLDVADDYEQWSKVMKVYFMVFVALVVLHSKKHIMALAWVCAGSMAVLGAKGGLFVLTTGGNYRVWGPPGTFIQDNNEFAVALIMTIPILRFLQLQLSDAWGRRLMTIAMLLCVASAVGTHSRGALLGISAMTLLLWWRGQHRLRNGLLIGLVVTSVLSFMPDAWFARMNTIETYEEDQSAMGRISAWWTAWNLARDYVTGVGFNAVRASLFAQYSPYPDMVQAAHSIYFQVLGHHGFIGLLLFLLVWLLTWRNAAWFRKNVAGIPEARWCVDLGNMCQACLLGYFVGGAFLSLAYFDLPYNVMVLLVLTRVWCVNRGWITETAPAGHWVLPGLNPPASRSK